MEKSIKVYHKHLPLCTNIKEWRLCIFFLQRKLVNRLFWETPGPAPHNSIKLYVDKIFLCQALTNQFSKQTWGKWLLYLRPFCSCSHKKHLLVIFVQQVKQKEVQPQTNLVYFLLPLMVKPTMNVQQIITLTKLYGVKQEMQDQDKKSRHIDIRH